MSGAVITNGSKPTASAGGICTLNTRRTAMEQSTVTPTTLDRHKWHATTPMDAVRTHTRGNKAGRSIQPGISGWPKSSYAITMSGGKRIRRRPLSWAGTPRSNTNVSRVTTQKRSWGAFSSVHRSPGNHSWNTWTAHRGACRNAATSTESPPNPSAPGR
jgi:hypothetical protein